MKKMLITAKNDFRPNNWAERLALNFAVFNGKQYTYNDCVLPIHNPDGTTSLIVDSKIEEQIEGAMKYLLWFADFNEMETVEVC